MTCPECKGHKGIFGRSPMGYPATLPCPTCDAMGEISGLQDALKNRRKNKQEMKEGA